VATEGWFKGKLGDILTLQRGFDLPKDKREDGPVPIVSSAGISGNHNMSKVSAPGIVTGRYGTLGEVFFLKKAFWPLNTALYVKDFKGNDPHFLSYFMRTLNLASQNAAGAVPGLNRNALHLLPVAIPSLETQRKIASILSAYDDLLENNIRRIKILEEMAQTLYREWFVNFRFPGHENVKMVDSPLGKIPGGWVVISLADLMEIKGGAQPPKSNFVYEPQDGFVRLVQIRDYQTDSHLCFVPEAKNLRRCSPEDIMIARYGASVGRIMWGLEGAYNVAIAKVNTRRENIQEFLRQYLLSYEFQKTIIGMSGRAAQAGFNKADIAAVKLAIPQNADLLEQFEKRTYPILKMNLVLNKKIKKLRQARDLLLPKLISGAIDVLELTE
jgi:type I restriction enzyme S subunit